ARQDARPATARGAPQHGARVRVDLLERNLLHTPATEERFECRASILPRLAHTHIIAIQKQIGCVEHQRGILRRARALRTAFRRALLSNLSNEDEGPSDATGE